MAAIYGIVAAALILIAALGGRDRIHFGRDLVMLTGAMMFVMVVGVLLYGRWRRVGSVVFLLTTFLLVCLTSIMVSFVAATDRVPLRDPLLSRADRAIVPGMDWPSLVLGLDRHPWLIDVGNLVYASPYWQSTILVVLLCATRRSPVAWRFVLCWTCALTATMAIFAVMPAAGAYAYFGIPHRAVPDIASDAGWRQPAMLVMLRRQLPVTVDTGSLAGIVAFPSFHAAAAVLLARGFWVLRLLRWPALLVNAAMLVASVPMGGHYVVDILAGMLVAGTCLVVVPL